MLSKISVSDRELVYCPLDFKIAQLGLLIVCEGLRVTEIRYFGTCDTRRAGRI